MDSSEITHVQAEQLRRQVGRQLNYFQRLCRRMELLGFPPNDPLYVAADRAYKAAQELSVRAQHCSCEGGVGRPPEGERPAWIRARGD